MKKLIYLTVLFIIFSCEKDEEKPNEIPVFKTIIERNFKAKVVNEIPQTDEFISKYVYSYNNKGNEIEVLSYDKTETLENRTIWEYDSNDILTAGTSFDKNGNITFTYEVEYNNNGQMVKWLVYYPDGVLMTGDNSSYIYDGSGNMIESISIDGSFERKNTYKYDENKNVIEEKEFINDELVSSSSKEYDEFDLNNNWTRAIEYNWHSYEDTTYLRIIKRVIEYY